MTWKYDRVKSTTMSFREAFEANFIPEPNSGCWLWIGPLFLRGGYGSFNYDTYTMLRAHRVAWMMYKKQTLTREQHVLHTCDIRICVNPDHLWLGTQKDNMRDMAMKGRQLLGEKNPSYIHGRYIGDKRNPEYHQ